MGKEEVEVEWSVSEDEQAWQTGQTAPESGSKAEAEASSRLGSRAERHLALLTVLLFLLLAGVWVWRWQTPSATIASELQATAAQEFGAQPTGGESTSSSAYGELETTLPGVENVTQFSVLKFTSSPFHHSSRLGEDDGIGYRVMAQVTASYPAAGPSGHPETQAYREMRFYRQSSKGWQRIEPDPALMGPWQTLETAHFTIRYRPIDASAVSATASKLDLLYAKLRGDFGLLLAAVNAKQTIEVATDGALDGYAIDFVMRTIRIPSLDGYAIDYPTRTIKVPSPALLSVPVEMTAAAVFYQSVVYPLASLLLADVVAQYQYPGRWNVGAMKWSPLMEALRLWALWEEEGPLAAGRQDVVRWLYQNAQAEPVEARQAVPAGYEHLCRAYHIWGISPESMAIPLGCSEVDHQRWSAWRYPALPTRLTQRPYIEKSRSLAEAASDSAVATETIIEYVVATYGRDRLPQLIAAWGEHASWETLIPAVFGIPAAEFEAGWQAYLASRESVN
jgi:hypothetical protein